MAVAPAVARPLTTVVGSSDQQEDGGDMDCAKQAATAINNNDQQ